MRFESGANTSGLQITLDELIDGEDIALCPSCSLRLRVVYDEEALEAIAEKHGIE